MSYCLLCLNLRQTSTLNRQVIVKTRGKTLHSMENTRISRGTPGEMPPRGEAG